jgi:hypothetical protein
MAEMKITVDLSELKGLLAKAPMVNKVAQVAINKVMGTIFERSQQLVPVDTGALKASGQLNTRKPTFATTGAGAEIIYGDDIVDYAIYVHEDLSKEHAAPTQSKFLEIPALENEKDLVAEIQKNISLLLGSNTVLQAPTKMPPLDFSKGN